MKLLDGHVSIVVLGIAQDAGLPHAGCRCARCQAAFADQNLSQFASSIAVIDARQKPARTWIIDATPDIKHQLNLVREALGPHPVRPERLQQPDGLFLTHGHMGHVSGLVYLGPEGMAVQAMKVYASTSLIGSLRDTPLWSPLIDNLELIPVVSQRPVELAPGLIITPIPIPHRDETGTDTFAYQIKGETKTLLYVPDIDSWDLWTEARDYLGAADVALVDASFYSLEEIRGRSSVSHPLVSETLAFFSDIPTRLVLIHINHTNPLLDRDSAERHFVESKGVEVAFSGQRLLL
jgi:pyrroloquinoline quinone biosynthesis protein B